MNKKLLLTMFLSMFMISMSFAVTLDDAQVYYSFDANDTTGTTMIDVSGATQYNGTCTDMASNCNTIVGKLINASDLDGTNDYIYIPDITGGETTKSINFWYNPDNVGTTEYIFAAYGTGGVNRWYVTRTGSNQISLTAGSTYTSSGVFLSNGVWSMITITLDNVNNKILMYQNGAVKLNTSYTDDFNNGNLWTIGWAQTAGNYDNAQFDEFAVYNKILNSSEIAGLYNSGTGYNPYLYTPPIAPLSITTNLTNGEYFNSDDISIEVNTSITSDAMFYYLNNTNYIIEDGLVAYYNFDGDYLDATANGNDGTNSGTVLNQAELTGTITGATFTSSSKVGKYAMSFDGIGDYISTPNVNSLDITDEITLSAWINFNDTPSNQYNSIISKYWSGYELYTRNYGEGIQMLLSGTTGNCYTTTGSGLTDENWHHVLSKFNGNYGEIWIDNTLELNCSISGTIDTNTRALYIGSRETNNYFNGSLDDVRIYDRALTTQEISDIYTSNDLANDVRQSNANRFNFEEGSGTTTAGQPIIPLDVQQVEFDGINDYVETSNLLDANTNTISFWYYLNEYEQNNGFIGNDRAVDRGFVFYMYSDKYRLQLRKPDDSGWYYDGTFGSIKTNTWTYITMVQDGTNLLVYENNNNILNTTGTTSTIKVNGENFYLGRSYYDDTQQRFLNGSMDEVRIYDRALTTTEIETLYTESPYTKICDNCNSSYINLYNLEETNYNISFLAIASQTIATLEQNFNIDLTLPVITDTLPSEINSYYLNISNYVSCSDSNLKTCNITFTPDGNTVLVNQTSLYNFTYNGNQSYNIQAEDQAGNTINKSGVILVNPYAYFNFQLSGTPITNYTLGGISFETEANFTIYGDTLNGLGSKSLEWAKLGYLTQTINFNVNNTSRINETYNISEATINVNIYDKTTLALINGVNISLEFVATVGASTTTTTGTKSISNVLFQNEQYTLIVGNANYETEQAIFNFDNQENITLNVYMIETNASNLGYVRVKALNLIGQVIPSAVVQALQWDSSSSSYIKVSETQTSEDGIGNLNILLDDEYYIFTAYTTTDNAVNSTPQIIATADNGKIIELTLSDITSETLGLLQGVYTNITEDYNETSLQSNITFKWTNSHGGALTPCISVYRLNGVKDKTLVSRSCATPSSSGTLLKSYTINSSYDYVIIGEYLLSSGGYLEMDSFVHYGQMHISNLITDYGLQYYVLIVIFLACLYIILEKSALIGTTMLGGLSGISIFVIPSILSKSVLAFVMFICIAIVISIMRGDK